MTVGEPNIHPDFEHFFLSFTFDGEKELFVENLRSAVKHTFGKYRDFHQPEKELEVGCRKIFEEIFFLTGKRKREGQGGRETLKGPFENLMENWQANRGDYELAVAAYFFFYKAVSEKKYVRRITREIFADKRSLEDFLGVNGKTDPPPLPLFFPKEIKDNEAWLNTNNFTTIPLVGRGFELDLLDEFLGCDAKFSILPIVAPSGAGKTRLVTEWMHSRVDLKEWSAGFLDNNDSSQWESWDPTGNSLIVIDYLYQFTDAIRVIVETSIMQTKGNVRLIAIDRIFPPRLKDITNDPIWNIFAGSKTEFDARKQYFFEKAPFRLNETNRNKGQLKKIISITSGYKMSSPQVSSAIEKLNSMGAAAQYPLFAALAGNAISNDGQIEAMNRRELVAYYLSSDNRLPWSFADNYEFGELSPSDGELISILVSAATVLNGFSYSDIADSLTKKFDFRYSDMRSIIRHCNGIVSNDEAGIVKPFKPSILGETFFLLFLIEFSNSNSVMNLLNSILSNLRENSNETTNISGFFFGLATNLLLDDDDEFKQMSWKALYAIGNIENLPDKEPSSTSREIRSSLFTTLYFEKSEESWAVIDELFSYDDSLPFGSSDPIVLLAGATVALSIDKDIKEHPEKFRKFRSRGSLLLKKPASKSKAYSSIFWLLIGVLILIPISPFLYIWHKIRKLMSGNRSN